MAIEPPDRLTLLVDDRERDPQFQPGSKFTFPWNDHRGYSCEFPVTVVRQRMESGDYGFAGYERYSLADKKGSIGEVRQNLFAARAERTRFFKCIQRLCKSTRYPILLLTFPPDDSFSTAVNFTQTEDMVWCRLMTWVKRHNLTLLMWDTNASPTYRRAAGRRLCQMMWTFAWEEIMKGTTDARDSTAGAGQSGTRFTVPPFP